VDPTETGYHATLRRLFDLFKVMCAGLATGLITPWLQPLLDRVDLPPGGVGVALMALPFALLVQWLVWRTGRRWWTATLAALVTMLAFVAAVNVAILVDALTFDSGRNIRNALAGLAGWIFNLALLFWIAIGFALVAALLNAIFDFCLGCELYLLGKRLTAKPATGAAS